MSNGESKNVQKDLDVGGDNAGRDITKNVTTINVPACDNSHPAAIFIAGLAKKYRLQKEGNIEFRQTLEKLGHYQNLAVSDDPLTLEDKLREGGREDLIGFALKTKEMFAKKLTKHSLFESAQEIHGFLLAEVYARYHEFVYGAVCRKESETVINALIRTQIIEPLLGILGENVLGHYSDEINGMLYFLTGNCHIKWTK